MKDSALSILVNLPFRPQATVSNRGQSEPFFPSLQSLNCSHLCYCNVHCNACCRTQPVMCMKDSELMRRLFFHIYRDENHTKTNLPCISFKGMAHPSMVTTKAINEAAYKPRRRRGSRLPKLIQQRPNVRLIGRIALGQGDLSQPVLESTHRHR